MSKLWKENQTLKQENAAQKELIKSYGRCNEAINKENITYFREIESLKRGRLSKFQAVLINIIGIAVGVWAGKQGTFDFMGF